MSLTAKTEFDASVVSTSAKYDDFVTMSVAGQLFGIPVLTIQDVLGPQRITRVPLAQPEIAGSLNLRGRIVTAIDFRTRMGLEPRPHGEDGMNVVVEVEGEQYSLVVDSVGEVLSPAPDHFEHTPATLDPIWRQIAAGVYRLDDRLMVVVDVAKLLEIEQAEAA
jgi:purine-binding chemotaxis protein CheW